MVIFPHVPKTGGTTLKAALAGAFGDRLRLDYEDRPLSHPGPVRKLRALLAMRHPPGAGEFDCIYGHFLPVKYARVPGAAFVTWLRDPVQRMLSRYHHYVRASEAGEATLPPGLSLEAFCGIPRFQDTYAKYLWRFPLQRFDFIGLTERFEESLAVFSRRYGIDCDLPRHALNANPRRDTPGYDVPRDVARMILATNAADAAIYEQACRRFGSPGGRGA